MNLGKTIETPLGPVRLVACNGALTGVYLSAQRPIEAEDGDDPILDQAARELREYFAGERTTFDVPLRTTGTPFQERVWLALRDIPFGEKRSYGELARALNIPEAARAVGGANAKNPLSIIVPCHRVLGASGALTGYAGGQAAKRWLLEHESRRPPRGDSWCADSTRPQLSSRRTGIASQTAPSAESRARSVSRSRT